MSELIYTILIIIMLTIALVLVVPWVGAVTDRYLDWCLKIQSKWKR